MVNKKPLFNKLEHWITAETVTYKSSRKNVRLERGEGSLSIACRTSISCQVGNKCAVLWSELNTK